jgi:uncharacterized protein (UPF0212 family)
MTMSSTGAPHPEPHTHENIQDALFALRDSLMSLKMSLLELAASSDPHIQQFAQKETQQLLARLRP